jgi:hypothetical protein
VILGLVATVLTMGICAAVSFAVNQRMRDLGIRVAVGAGRGEIMRDVFRMGGGPVMRGLLFGSWMSVAFAASLCENLRGTVLASTRPIRWCIASRWRFSAWRHYWR